MAFIFLTLEIKTSEYSYSPFLIVSSNSNNIYLLKRTEAFDATRVSILNLRPLSIWEEPKVNNSPEDKLTAFGVDVNFDGLGDDVTGPNGVPDGLSDSLDILSNAGVVYVIFGSTRLDQIPTQDITINIDDLGGNYLTGFIIAGRRAGDRIGGGDAGDIAMGGILGKLDRGRSNGLATAGDVDGDGREDFLIGSILADPRIDPSSGIGVINGGEAYLIYGSVAP